MTGKGQQVINLAEVGIDDVPRVGGKNASLGEMLRTLAGEGVKVPLGFATTADAYWRFVAANGLAEVMRAALRDLKTGKETLQRTGEHIRRAFRRGDWPEDTTQEIRAAYRDLCRRVGRDDVDVAVRSSATAEDLPGASFAGQQETFLNISGEAAMLDACRRCFASLFTDRAISYREAMGFDHLKVALSVGVQLMVRSDLGGAGVMFSIDTETGFGDVVLIDAAWGLGENVVQGAVDPDEYVAFKPLLGDPKLVPVMERKLGGKAQKMVYAREGERTTRNVPTSLAERAAYVLDDQEILESRPLGLRYRTALRLPDGHGMGQRWADRGAIYSSGAPRDGTVARRSGRHQVLPYQIERAQTGIRAQHRRRGGGRKSMPHPQSA